LMKELDEMCRPVPRLSFFLFVFTWLETLDAGMPKAFYQRIVLMMRNSATYVYAC